MHQENENDELHQTLKKLCENLNEFLAKTQESLLISKDRFKQVKLALEPFKIEQKQTPTTDIKCTCNDLPLVNDASELLTSVSKMLSSAQSLRLKKSKSKVSTTTSVKSVNLKNEITTKPSCSSVNISTDGGNIHKPSCPLFQIDNNTKSSTLLTLSEAITARKVPSGLFRTVKNCYKILNEIDVEENKININAKTIFLQCLTQQNTVNRSIFEKNNYSTTSIFKYASAIKDYRKNDEVISNNWLFYKSISDLHEYQELNSILLNTNSWNFILNFINKKLLPILEKSEISQKDKISIYKLLKTICNFTQSNVPRVPVFRVSIQ